jgi:hypothetical protein
MAIRIYTDTPAALLKSIKKQMDDGGTDTWSYDKDGDFTHSVAQFDQKAWLRPAAIDEGLRLRILKPEGEELPRAIYSIYHGRFIEMLVTHVPTLFSRAVATSDPASNEPALVG